MARIKINLDHERLPPSTRAGELRPNDIQIFNNHVYRVANAWWSKSGMMRVVEYEDACAMVGHTPDPTLRWARSCRHHFVWNRRKNASAQRVIYRIVPIIRESPLP